MNKLLRYKSERYLTFFLLILTFLIAGSIYLWQQNQLDEEEQLVYLMDDATDEIVEASATLDLYYYSGNYLHLQAFEAHLNQLQHITHGLINEEAEPNVASEISIPTFADLKKTTQCSDFEKQLAVVSDMYQQLIKNIDKEAFAATIDKTYQNQTFTIDISAEDLELLYKLKDSLPQLIVSWKSFKELVILRLNERSIRVNIVFWSLQFLALCCLIGLFYNLRKRLFKPAKKISHLARELANGNIKNVSRSTGAGDLLEIEDSLIKLSDHIQNATQFATHIGEGKLNTNHGSINENDSLGKALLEMQNKLQEVADEEGKRNWAVNGIAQFSELLRQQQHAELNELSYQFIKDLVKYLDGNQGGVFLINEEDSDDKFIELTGCYAYERRKQLKKRLEMEEGLIGQAILEKDTLYIEDLPDNYINITSGLGKKLPTSILIVPIKVNEEIFGVVELAFFEFLEKYQIDFVENVCETFGSTLSSSKMNLRTKKLLSDSQSINLELQQKEEQMRQNAEELQSTQEELSRKLSELETETNLSQNIIDAINKTNATIEFDLSGKILSVNDMYLSVMGFTRDELVGKNEAQLIPKDEVDSGRYKMLWDSLQNGSFMAGEYRRVSKGGREVWLNGTYNPIFDISGKPFKIIQFAQFTTEEKEKDLDLSSKINAISGTFPLIELDLERKIKSSNQEFINLFGYKRLEIRNKEIEFFIDDEMQDEIKLFVEEAKSDFKSQVFGFKKKDGEVRYCLTIGTPIKNLSGDVYKMMSVLVDITEQKKLEIELIHNQSQLSETIQELKDTKQMLIEQKNEVESRVKMLDRAANIFEVDLEGNLIVVNDALCENFGICRDEMIGKTFLSFVCTSDQSTVNEMWKQVNNGKVARKVVRLINKKSKEFFVDVTISPVFDLEHEPCKFLGIMYDVTNQMTIQSELRDDLAKEKMKNSILSLQSTEENYDINIAFSELLSALDVDGSIDYQKMIQDVPVIQLDDSGIIKHITIPAEKLMGINKDDLSNKPLSKFLNLSDKSHQELLLSKLVHGSVLRETIIMNLNKIDVPFEMISMPLFCNNARDTKILVFISKKSSVKV